MLNPCRYCGAPAIQQVRGELVQGDIGWVPPLDPAHPDHQTSNAPANAKDQRVTCSKCDNALGWNQGEMADYSRFCWNRDNPVQQHVAPAKPQMVRRALG